MGAFHELAVTDAKLPAISKSEAVTVPHIEIPQAGSEARAAARPIAGLRLTTPDGFVIKGLDESRVPDLLSRLRAGGTHAS